MTGSRAGQVYELAGPAGAGKTTLAHTLVREQGDFTLGLPAGRAAMLAGVLGAVPMLLHGRASTAHGPWTAADLRSIGYLHAWRRHAAEQHRPGRHGAVLLDHGPAYRLASLVLGECDTGAPAPLTDAFRQWWTRTAISWSSVLDAVVWLDAPDDVLAARIEGRDRFHRVRGGGADQVQAFLERYRDSYAAVLDLLDRCGTRVIHVNTGAGTPEELAARVRTALGDSIPGRLR